MTRPDSAHRQPLPRAVLFDMDGTLTRPMLDFPLIKREIGIGAEPILEALARMSPTDRERAESILLRHEQAAALGSTLNDGCRELLHWLREHGIATALITRNSRRSVKTVIELHALETSVLIAREDAAPKPDPAPLLMACSKLGVEPPQAWMVGDGEFDVAAGRAAGIQTVWISHGKARTFASQPDVTCTDLVELLARLRRP